MKFTEAARCVALLVEWYARFVVQIGALLLVDDEDGTITLKEVYLKVAEEKNDCSWEGFKVYEHLKYLGYIVGRFGIPWILKSLSSCSIGFEGDSENDNNAKNIVDSTSFAQSLRGLQLTEVNPLSKDYLPQKLNETCLKESKCAIYLCMKFIFQTASLRRHVLEIRILLFIQSVATHLLFLVSKSWRDEAMVFLQKLVM